MQSRQYNFQIKVSGAEDIETGGHSDHPLGTHPTLWMRTQYQAAHRRAIQHKKNDRWRKHSIKYDSQLVYPSYGFLLKRLIIRIAFILIKRHRAHYPKIELTELAYLKSPSFLLKKLRFLMAKIKLILCGRLHHKI